MLIKEVNDDDNFILDTNKGKELIQKQIRSPFANNSIIEKDEYIVNLFIEGEV